MVYIAGIALIYLLILVFYGSSIDKSEEYRRKAYIFSSFSIMFLISALRDCEVGIDTINYINKFYLIQKYTITEIFSSLYCERIEFGYAFMNKIVGILFGDARAMIVLNSFVVCFGLAHFIIKYTDSDVTAVVLFVCSGIYLVSLNIARQMMACVLLLNSWGALTHNQYRKSGILFFSSLSIHVFSIVFLAVYFFYFIRQNRIAVILLYLLSLVVIFNYERIIRFASRFLTSFSYLDNQKPVISLGAIQLVWLIEILVSVSFFVMYLFNRMVRIYGKGKEETILSSSDMACIPIFVSYYIIFTYLGTKFNYLDRIGYFFLPFCNCLFLNFGKVIRIRFPSMYRWYVILLHFCFICFFILSTQSSQYHYSFMW